MKKVWKMLFVPVILLNQQKVYTLLHKSKYVVDGFVVIMSYICTRAKSFTEFTPTIDI